MEDNFIQIYQRAFKDNANLPALTDYGRTNTVTYLQLAANIAKMHIFYRNIGLGKGDKIALIGKNTSQWVTVYISAITYGAVIVPILQEFNPLDVQHIINHSGSTVLFTTKAIWDNLDFDGLSSIRAAINVDTLALLAQKDGETVGDSLDSLERDYATRYPHGFNTGDITYPDAQLDSVAVLNYTSGTTGYSKGVMITVRNITGNTRYGVASGLHFRGSRCLSFLPLAHAYGAAFDMLVPLATGTHITLLGRIPSPKVLINAMQDVKPDLIVTVPLILEKVYRKQIVPLISRGMMRWALNIPYLDNKIYEQIRHKLVNAFGGRFEEVIIGGAPLNPEVEDFLQKIKFPYTVGYGMTECAPLISHTPWREFVPHSAGRVLPGIMQCKILSDDPENTPGEICVKGENVMQGYYKNTEATDKVLHDDQWLHTGDMGTLSPDGTLFIKGRCKTMLLGANGQNIYPEEIEAKLGNMLYVTESLVVERNGKLVALVYPDYEVMDKLGTTTEQLPEIMENIRREVNKMVAAYEQISAIELQACEFEKTPKRSIKRFLYK